MFGYKDITFCSNEECRNVQCERNLKNVPWDKLPDYMGVSVTDFAGKFRCCPMPLPEPPKEDSHV